MSRKWTPDYVAPDGMTHMTLKRCCNGCGRPLGDVTDAELGAAISGFPMPDVTGECGCGDGKAKDTPELGPQEHCRIPLTKNERPNHA